jgi:hypothetical protein
MTVLLTVRGTFASKSLDNARVLHNETAGSPPGIAAARALGDLSHNVFVAGKGPRSTARDGEILFLDRWANAQGIGQFFGNANVQEQAGKLFTKRDAAVWMPAEGAYSYVLPVPKARRERIVAVLRAPITDAKAAIAVFAKVDAQARAIARKRGLISHELFIKIAQPGEPLELLGMDVWYDAAGMAEHYGDPEHISEIFAALSGQPDPSVWFEAPGDWSEW